MSSKIVLVCLIFALSLPACHHRYSHSSFFLGISLSPVIINREHQKVYIHDGHIHDEFCGHPKKWYNDRWVYFYNGRWEYYDYKEGVYYYIPEELINNSDE